MVRQHPHTGQADQPGRTYGLGPHIGPRTHKARWQARSGVHDDFQHQYAYKYAQVT